LEDLAALVAVVVLLELAGLLVQVGQLLLQLTLDTAARLLLGSVLRINITRGLEVTAERVDYLVRLIAAHPGLQGTLRVSTLCITTQ